MTVLTVNVVDTRSLRAGAAPSDVPGPVDLLAWSPGHVGTALWRGYDPWGTFDIEPR